MRRTADSPSLQEQRKRLIDCNRGITGFMKLLRQIGIIDRRIRSNTGSTQSTSPVQFDELLLDTECFYTIANDALKLIEVFLHRGERERFRAERPYKIICRLRSRSVRHAYDKPDGNSYPGFGFSPHSGLVLKAGSRASEESGYTEHFAEFWKMLQGHSIITSSSTDQPMLTERFCRRFTGIETL
jgi:hypothetical protein